MADEKGKKVIAEMSDEELAELAAKLEEDRIQLQAARKAIGLEQEMRQIRAEQQAKLDKLSEKDREVLRELLNAPKTEPAPVDPTPAV